MTPSIIEKKPKELLVKILKKIYKDFDAMDVDVTDNNDNPYNNQDVWDYLENICDTYFRNSNNSDKDIGFLWEIARLNNDVEGNNLMFPKLIAATVETKAFVYQRVTEFWSSIIENYSKELIQSYIDGDDFSYYDGGFDDSTVTDTETVDHETEITEWEINESKEKHNVIKENNSKEINDLKLLRKKIDNRLNELNAN